jgi:molybdopterin synthase catalytic subunit
MKAKVLFFGPLQDATGFSQEEIELRDGETLDELWRAYQRRYPRLDKMAASVFAAVNQQAGEWSRGLQDGDEIAFMPPVSGGGGDDFYVITRAPIIAGDWVGRLKRPESGAVVVFEGVVRNHSRGRQVLFLDYEAYEPMALAKMEEIAREARQGLALDGLGIVHRVGRVGLGETSVLVVVTAAHREAAFGACRYVIDRLKQVVPIWKKEHFADGAEWVESEGQFELRLDA